MFGVQVLSASCAALRGGGVGGGGGGGGRWGHEGKMKRTWKRELKVLETAELEANGTSALVEIVAGGCDIRAILARSRVLTGFLQSSTSMAETPKS